MGYLKTAVLMAAMTALFMGAGAMIGGSSGMIVALALAAAMNLFAWWGSDKAVLRMYGAREVGPDHDLTRMVQDLADRAGLPRPRVYVIDQSQPNAFATGRNPQNAAVAATTGLLQRLSRDEIAAVMAHELAHIRNRDTLIMTITATFAGAVSMLANFAFFFGGNRDREGGFVAQLALMILAPLAAALVQMAISRSREYEADRVGAEICGQPRALASALLRIERMAQGIDYAAAERNPATAHMFIINPCTPMPGIGCSRPIPQPRTAWRNWCGWRKPVRSRPAASLRHGAAGPVPGPDRTGFTPRSWPPAGAPGPAGPLPPQPEPAADR